MQIREANIADASKIARVRIESWRTTYRGILPEAYLDNLSMSGLTRTWNQILRAEGRQGFTYVAENSQGEVVGFAIGGPERSANSFYQGELYAIYLLQEQQHKGLGSRLVSAVAGRLVQTGIFSMLVWVLADNPSRGFYEKLGGKFVYEKAVRIGGIALREVAYGWEDIQPLLEAK